MQSYQAVGTQQPQSQQQQQQQAAQSWDSQFVELYTSQVNSLNSDAGVAFCFNIAKDRQATNPREIVYAVESCVQVDCQYTHFVWSLLDQIVSVLGGRFIGEFSYHLAEVVSKHMLCTTPVVTRKYLEMLTRWHRVFSPGTSHQPNSTAANSSTSSLGGISKR